MDQPDEVKIKLSSKIGKKAPVFISEFINGPLISDSRVQFECFKSEDNESMIDNGCAKRKLMANKGRFTYVGASNDESIFRYYVGVRDKSTGKMKLYDSTLFRLKPVISNDIVNDSPTINVEKSYWEDRNKLTEEFGAKAKKRGLKAMLKLDRNYPLDELITDDSINASPLPADPFANSPSNASYLPPANKDAQSLDKVFDIKDIISPDIDASLHDYAKSWLETYKTDANAAKNFCSFVLQYMDVNLDDMEKVKYLLYYNYLVIFQHLTYKDMRKKDPTDLIPEPFKGYMLKTFTIFTKSEAGRPSRTFPSQQKDKLVSHLIILALLINDYCVCMSHILSDLKLVHPKKCTTIAQALGCYITSQKIVDQSDKFIELKLPLNVVLPRYTKRQF